MPATPGDMLNILHILRAPVGGLFRHVADLARGQTARGHRVGIVCDATTGGAAAQATLAALSSELALGVTRIPMSRHVGMSDAGAVRHVARRAAETRAQVLHGHGAKGGAYARLASAPHAIRVYTPHGGSLHFRWGSPTGFLYLAAERMLMARTDLFLFESEYGCDVFGAKLGRPAARVTVVHNGVNESEFAPVMAESDACDVVFVGELRHLKGVDVLIDALALLRGEGRHLRAAIVGDGPDRQRFETQAADLGLGGAVSFTGALPARTAFARGRLLVMPSRAESLPYVVLEAAAAGMPMIATRVGGIAEIFGPDADALVPAGDAARLAEAIKDRLNDIGGKIPMAGRLRERVRSHFSIDAMTDAVLAGYREVIAAKHG